MSSTRSAALGEENAVKEEPEGEEGPNPSRAETALPFNHDVVNVSEGFQLRTAYKKVVKASKLDGLLERRVRQFTLEEKQRLERFKMGEQARGEPAKEKAEVKAEVKESPGETIQADGAVNTKEQEKSQATQVEEKESVNVSREKDSVVQRLEFDQEEERMKSGAAAAEQKGSASSQGTAGEIQSPSETNKGQMASGLVKDNVSLASTPSDGHGNNDQSNGKSDRPAELNGASQESVNPSPSQNVTSNSLTEAPSLKSEGTASRNCTEQMVLGENGSKHTQGKECCVLQDEGESMDVPERDYVRTEKSGLVQINGKDAPLPHNKTSTLMELASNVAAKEVPATLEGGMNAMDPLKPLTNGDAVTLDSRQEKTNCLENTEERKATELASDCPIPQKVPRLENNMDEASADSTVTSSGLGGRRDTPDTTKLEVEVTKPKQLAPSPVTSMEESSLSSDAAENGGGSNSSMAEVKTTVTQVTTTTSSTTTVSTVQIAEVTSSSSAPPIPEPKVEANSTTATLTTTTTTVTKVTDPASGKVVTDKKTSVTATFTNTKSSPSGSSTTSMTVSKEYSTRDRVRLLKFSRTKKSRSGTALPSYRKFVTKSSKKSIFVLPNDDLKKMARRGGIREVPIFNYNAKPALDIWPYPSPRPTFGITWRSV